ncbi:MAG: DUF2812 domain-containing protein [Roseiflexaceae bacterium]|jgi:hypothetical protein|nr:DUF2812 domain-containing protein [Chloroflexaceae bacterium]
MNESSWHKQIPITRLELIAGLACSVEEDLQHMSQWAAEGWQVVAVRRMCVVLERATPEQVLFAVDYQTSPDDEYYALCHVAGWTHVLSLSNTIHLFKAPVGTRPLFSTHDNSIIVRAQQQLQHMALLSSLVLVVMTWLISTLLWPWLWVVDRGILGWVLAGIGMVSMYAVSVVVWHTVLPWLVYQVRRYGIALRWSRRRAQVLVDGVSVMTGALFGLMLGY